MARPKMTIGQAIAVGKAQAVPKDEGARELADDDWCKAVADQERARTAEAAAKQLDVLAREAARTLQAARRARGERDQARAQLAATSLAQEAAAGSVAVASLSSGHEVGDRKGKRVAPLPPEDSGADHMSGVEPPEAGEGTIHPRGPCFEVGESSRRITVQQRKEVVVPDAPPASRMRKRAAPAPAQDHFVCTACGSGVHVTNVKQHPNLPVGICVNCFAFIFSSPYTKDIAPDGSHGHENQCRWCGDGGNVILCDTCDKAFCKDCIKRNFGVAGLTAIEEEPALQWSCYFCDPTPLDSLRRQFQSIEAQLKKPTNVDRTEASKCQKRPYKPRQRRNNTAREGETVAAAIARQQDEMQRQNPGVDFSGFRVKKPRRPRRPSPGSNEPRRRRTWSRKAMGNGEERGDVP